MRVWRSIGAVLAGMLATFIMIAIIQLIGHAIFPPPEGIEKMTYQELRAVLIAAPPWVFVPVLVAYVVGTFVGGFVAAWLAPSARMAHALVIGFLFTLTGIMNAFLMPQPLWVSAVSLICFLPAALLGAKLVMKLWPADGGREQPTPIVYESE